MASQREFWPLSLYTRARRENPNGQGARGVSDPVQLSARYYESRQGEDGRCILIKDRATGRSILVVSDEREEQMRVLKALNHYEETAA